MSAQPDFGPCSECGMSNSHLMTRCHKCRALLLWAQAPGAPSASGAGPAPSAGSPRIASDVDYKAMGVQLLRGVIFLVGVGLFIGNVTGTFRTFSGAGWIAMAIGGAIWKAGSGE